MVAYYSPHQDQWWYSTDSGTATSATTWATWTRGTYATAATTTWATWNDSSSYQAPQVRPRPVLTAEEAAQARAELEQMRLETEARAKRAAERAAEGQRKAEALLREHLTAGQLEQLAKDKWFEVVGSRGGRYRLAEGDGKVLLLDPATLRAVASFCIHPDQDYPMGDQLLCKKLLLEADEEAFLKTANRTELRAAAR